MTLSSVNTTYAFDFSNDQSTQLALMQKPEANRVGYKPYPTDINHDIKKGQRVWQSEINTLQTWAQLSTPIRDAEMSKFVINIKNNNVYFIDANVFTLHKDFVLGYLLKLPYNAENIKSFNRNYSTQKPDFILGYITHYPNMNEWAFSFWEGDKIQAQQINDVAEHLKQHFKIASLKFRPDSSYQERVALQLNKKRITVIKNKQLYKSMPFQAFNTGKAIGKLTIVPSSTHLEDLQFNPNEIVILQQSYPDISPVSGIITTQFSTPLSHVNLRARAWNIPNATLKTAVQDFSHLNGQWVKLEVNEQKLTLVKASEEETLNSQRSEQEKKHVSLAKSDVHYKTLDTLNEIRLKDVGHFGAKTVHLGEMKQAGLPVPQGFGIPFYYYQLHMHTNGLDKKLEALLNDPNFKDPTWRKSKLLDLQSAIRQAPIDAKVLSMIDQRWKSTLENAPVFARSSTNAEDLARFNGAGLYDTVPNIKSLPKLEEAIKQVWASLWNKRAVDEREYFGIPHTQVYAGVLIQVGINASAAGVLLTTDIWSHQPETYTINAKWGLGMRVVEGQKIAEQILYDTTNQGTRVISRSDESTMLVFDKAGGIKEINVPKTEAIINESRAKQLGDLAKQVQALFPDYPTLDIEWVLEKNALGRDQFWLVQARPYLSKN